MSEGKELQQSGQVFPPWNDSTRPRRRIKDELVQEGAKFLVRCERQKTGTHINNVIPTWLGKELLMVKNGNPQYFFWSGNTSVEDAPSYFHKMYRRVFRASGLLEKRECGSHDFRHTYAVELLKAGVDIRKVSKALGHPRFR